MSILVTAPGAPVIASGQDIFAPSLDSLMEADAANARLNASVPGSLWPENMATQIDAWKSGETADLAEGKQVRFSWSSCLLSHRGPVFVEFDGGHPTRGFMQTPPAGIWEGGTPLEAALQELGEELLIKNGETLGFWSLNGKLLAPEWVTEYARDHNLTTDHSLAVEIEQLPDFPGRRTIHFGESNVDCLVEFESDTGSIEGIIPFRLKEGKLPDGIELIDGERLLNGTWLHRRVIYGFYTSKATACIEAFVLQTKKGAALVS